MFSLARILLPVDFSERTLGAARYVEALATRFHSQVTLLHVLPPPHYEFSALEVGGTVLNELFAARATQVSKELNEYLVSELQAFEPKRVLLEGDPARKIIEHANAEAANLIVMPTHGYGSFRRFILGSVTAKVLHDADCPVWTGVHLEQNTTQGPIQFRRVVCAVDLGLQSAKTLQWAASFARCYDASLVLVHAVPSMSAEPGTDDYSKELREQAKSELSRLLRESEAEAEILMAGGDPPKAVCDATAQAKGDLLVIGRGSAAGVFGRLRANAYAIIRQSPCPVVSV